MSSVCQYCNKKFSNSGNLNRHTRTAKTCLANRKEDYSTFKCEYCKIEFTQKISLKTHYPRCSKKQKDELSTKYLSKITKLKAKNKALAKENKNLKEKLSEQKGIVEGMKNAPDKRTIYNTAYVHPKLVNLPITNIPALTQEYMIEKVNDGILTYNHTSRGYPGILEVIGELITHENDSGIVERNYVCTDVSRNSFHRLLESKKWKSDKGGRYLNNMLDTFQDVMEEYKNKVYDLYDKTPHESIEWSQVDWERKNISMLYGGIVSREGTSDREELVNILRKEISKRASV